MDVEFFKSLDEKLKAQIQEALDLDPKKEKAPILFEIAKDACQILQYRGVLYQLQLPAKIEITRCFYFSGIEEILSILYEDFKSLSLKAKVHVYTTIRISPKSTVEKNEALVKIKGNLELLQTSWLNSYK